MAEKPKRKIIIRNFERRDRDDLIDNYLKVYEEAKKNPLVGITLFDKKPTLNKEYKWFRDLLKKVKNKEELALVAEVDGKTVGLCNMRMPSPQTESRHIGDIGILVREGYRSMGIGSLLFERVIKEARKKKYELVTLKVFGTNKHAQNLYRKFGFKEYGMLPGGIARKNRRIDEVLMYLKL